MELARAYKRLEQAAGQAAAALAWFVHVFAHDLDGPGGQPCVFCSAELA